MHEGFRDHGSFRVSHHLICFVFYRTAELSSTVLRVSQFHNAMIHAMRSSLNGASRVVLWECSAPVKTSSFFAMMVRTSSIVLPICHLTYFLRIRVVCKPPR